MRIGRVCGLHRKHDRRRHAGRIGFGTCTGPFANLSVYGAGGTDGYLAHVVRATASDCGLPSALSPPVLSTCAGAISKLRGVACGNDEDDDDQSNPRTPEKCASAACAASSQA